MHVADDQEAGGDREAGHHAGQEQPPDRLLGDDAPDDEGDRRRDQRPQHARADRERGGKGLVVAGAGHGRDHDRPHRRRGRRRRAGDGGEHGRRDHRHHGEAARTVPHQHAGGVDETAGQPACRHQLAGQHEQRDREQAEGLRAGDHLLREEGRLDVRHHHHGHGREADGDGEGHADRGQPDEGGHQHDRGGAHGGGDAPACPAPASARPPRARRRTGRPARRRTGPCRAAARWDRRSPPTPTRA